MTGFVTGENNEPLIQANILLIKGSTGISTNSDGEYFLKLPPGKHSLLITHLGYKPDTLNIILKKGETQKHDFQLVLLPITMNTVTIFSTMHSTAERIVLEAIENKEDYLSKIKNYVYSDYSRTNFFFRPDSGKEEIAGITEVQSQGYFSAPDNFQEIVLAKKQTANFTSLYNVFSSGRPISVLDDIMHIDELAVISPLSRKSLEYYSFDISDTMFVNSKRIFNITFKPKVKDIPLFKGKMSIVDQVFTVTNVELYGEEKVKAAAKSDIHLKQSFKEYEDYFWFPVQYAYEYSLDLGLKGLRKLYIRQQGNYYDYSINNPDFGHNYDNKLLMHASISAEAADSVWEKAQSIPLTVNEKKAYRAIDSSMKAKSGFVRTMILLPDYYLKLKQLPLTDLWDFYHMNRAEGSYVGIGLDSKEYMNFPHTQLAFGYGFNDNKFKYSAKVDFFAFGKVSVMASLFDHIAFLDSRYDYRRYDLVLNQLLFNNDYADYYYSKGVSCSIKYGFSRFMNASLSVTSERPTSIEEHKTFSLFNKDRVRRKSVSVADGEITKGEVTLTFDNRKYLDYGWGYIQNLGEDYFFAELSFTAAPEFLRRNSKPFNSYYLQLSGFTKLPPYLNLLLTLKAGYVDNKSVIQEQFHLPGAYSSFINSRVFHTLKNDVYLGDKFLAIFFENNFKNTLFNILPLPFLKNSKYDLLLVANTGWMNNQMWVNGNSADIKNIPFSEAGFAIGNIFFYMRVDFTWRITHREENKFTLKFSSLFNY